MADVVVGAGADPLGVGDDADLVAVPGGTFLMGSDGHYPEEGPAHPVRVDGFWMERWPVTNARFARFVAQTGYVTVAERPVDPALYPGVPPERLRPASVVFRQPSGPVDLTNHFNWWTYVLGACWRHPRGPGSSLEGLEDHPVVHVAYADAEAYAHWRGRALPSEAEWEHAARGGLQAAEFGWGDELAPGGRTMAKIWQGEFPHQNLAPPGQEWTAPVGSYPANGFGLQDMVGNVWEWTTDWYESRHRAPAGGCCPVDNPRGGVRERSIDRRAANAFIPRKVMKGGSFLCAVNYCRRYRPAARMAQPIDTATCHLGFRCLVRTRGL